MKRRMNAMEERIEFFLVLNVSVKQVIEEMAVR